MDNNSILEQTKDILTLSETAEYLKIAEKTLLRMIHRNEIPVAKVGSQYRFLRNVLEDWLISKMKVLPSNDVTRLIEQQGELLSVWRLLDEDCMVLDMKASDRESVLAELAGPLAEAGLISAIDTFTSKLLAREEMVSTAIENGVALPHLRKPEENPSGRPVIVFGRSKMGVDFGAPDGRKSHLFFLLCTDSEVIHLRVLSLLSRILHEPETIPSLEKAAGTADVVALIHKIERKVTGGKNGPGNNSKG